MLRQRRWLLMVMVVLGLAACSPRVVYGWLDWLIPWEVDDYVTLDRTQDLVLDSLIEQELDWHKSNELPLYREHLSELDRELAGELTEQQVLNHLVQSSQHWYRLMDRLIPKLTPLIQSFDDQQVAQILEQIEEDEQDLREEYEDLSPEKLRKRANKSMEKRLKKWLGRLNEDQKAAIKEYNDRRYSTLGLWLDYRQVWIERFSMALQNRAETGLLTNELEVLLVTPDAIKPDQYLDKIQSNRLQLAKGFVDIHAAMTKRQKKRLHGKITDLIEDVEYLLAKN